MTKTKEEVSVPAVISGQFNLALTENKYQSLVDTGNKLVFNEDNVESIKTFLEGLRKVEKVIEGVHEKGKAESLRVGREWDAAKNSFLALIKTVKDEKQQKFTVLCKAIADREDAVRKDEERKNLIKAGINTNAVLFSSQISEATTMAQLTKIESIINLEKTRSAKYQEFLPDAVARYTELNGILKTQKAAVVELEKIAKAEQEALAGNDDQAVIDLAEKREAAEQILEENKIIVQETAINQSVAAGTATYTQTYHTVKAKRSTWKWEVQDINLTQKKMPSFVKLVIDKDAVDAYLASKKAEGIKEEEFSVFGIKFFLEKTY